MLHRVTRAPTFTSLSQVMRRSTAQTGMMDLCYSKTSTQATTSGRMRLPRGCREVRQCKLPKAATSGWRLCVLTSKHSKKFLALLVMCGNDIESLIVRSTTCLVARKQVLRRTDGAVRALDLITVPLFSQLTASSRKELIERLKEVWL